MALKNVVDSLYVGVVSDTSQASTKAGIAEVAGGTGNNGTAGSTTVLFAAKGDTATSQTGALTVGRTSAQIDTFRLKFGVPAGADEFVSRSALKVNVFVKPQGSTNHYKFSNLETLNQVTASGTFAGTYLGDGKQFSMDGKRPATPIAGGGIDSVRIDTTGLAVFANVTGGRSIKSGNKVIVKLAMNIGQVISSGAASAKVVLVDSSNQGSAKAIIDSALYTKTFTDILVSEARDTFTVTTGQFKNRQRIIAAAFLQDAAGNLSSTASTDTNPTAFTSGLVYMADATLPTITAVNPNPDSSKTAFTGALSANYTYRNDSGVGSSTAFTFKPLEFKVNEPLKSGTVKFGSDSTVTLGATDLTNLNTLAAKTVPTDSGNVNNGGTSFARTAKAGSAMNLTISVVDSAGNSASKVLSGVTFDQVLPAISNLFPTSTKAPKNSANSNKPTINNLTRHPTLRLSEQLDSLSVRYVEVGGSPPTKAIQGLTSSNPDLAKVDTDIKVTVVDTLLDGRNYTLQVYARDKAGNITVTAPDTLTFTKNFNNPTADSFLVANTTGSDSVIAGQALKLTLTAIDSQLTRTSGSTQAAVTYNGVTRVRLAVADSEASKLAGVTFGGTGVSIASTDTGKGIAQLNGDGWLTGGRSVEIKSKWVLHNFTVWVENYSTATDGTVTVNFKGKKDSLSVDAAEMSKYMVMAVDANGAAVTGVQGAFQVKVMPTDWYGNPSTKTRQIATGGATYATGDSLDLLSTRINKANVLKQLFVEFSANMGDAGVPSGPQAVGPWGAMFTASAPNRNGTGLVISVRTFNQGADSSGVNSSAMKHLWAMGSSAELAFSGEGTPPPQGAPAKPDTLIVQNYKGADGNGDQGGFVMATFPKSATAGVTNYRIYREVWVTLDMVNGKLTTVPKTQKWVSWVSVAPVADASGVVRAVVPTLDNVATRWAVASESGGSASGTTVAAKRVFTKESVQQMVQFLGVDPNRVLSTDELSKLMTPPQDYVKSILGDLKNVQFAALDPDLSSLVGSGTVPQNIRTDASTILSSAQTISAIAVAGLDDLPPAAVTDAAGAPKDSGVDLTWKASTDDKVVAFSSYNGFSIPILGVAHYQVWRGTSADNMTLLTTLDPGTTSYRDTNLPQGVSSLLYRVDALDLDNQTMGTAVDVPLVGGRQHFVDAQGKPVFIVNLTGKTPLLEDFEDFIGFATSYQKKTGETGFNIQADTNDDGVVDFTDFINFAQAYQRTAVGPATKPVVTPVAPGVNDNTQLSLNLGTDRIVAGQTVTVNVSLANAKSLYGYGFTLNYDPTKFELVDAVPAQNDLLKSTGGETPLFLKYTQTPGQITIDNAVINGSVVSGDGQIATLTFKVLTEFEDQARFEIADGIVFDSNQLPNPVVTLGDLNVQSTPTEFALHQNFPNPFNPETTIKYDLAEGANVQLRIYNIVGQVVRTLVAEHQAAGRYQVRWNGTDDRGVAVSSGIYFYQVAAGKFQDVKRLMLLK